MKNISTFKESVSHRYLTASRIVFVHNNAQSDLCQWSQHCFAMLARSRHALPANLVDLQEMAGHPRHRGQEGSHTLTHSLLVIRKYYLAIKRSVISICLP